MRDQLFHLEARSGATLQTQLRQMLVAAIRDGQLPPGSALPSCRKLADTLAVARNTVALAYQDLVEEGFLVSRQRSGYFVSQEIDPGRLTPAPASGTAAAPLPDWFSRLRTRPSTQRNIVKPRNWQEFKYPFIYGQFDPALFPIADWRECSRQALSLPAVREWASDSFTDDDPQLIEQIRTLLLPRRGVFVQPDEILLTVGAQHAIFLLSALLIDERTTVGMEDPGYADARNIFLLRTSRLIGLPVDKDGMMDSPSLATCNYVHVTPSHQFPTTVTMSLARRQALLERAEREDFVFIEDDYEAEINHVGPADPGPEVARQAWPRHLRGLALQDPRPGPAHRLPRRCPGVDRRGSGAAPADAAPPAGQQPAHHGPVPLPRPLRFPAAARGPEPEAALGGDAGRARQAPDPLQIRGDQRRHGLLDRGAAGAGCPPIGEERGGGGHRHRNRRCAFPVG